MNSSGDIAQLARAPALQAGGPGFESLYLHQRKFFESFFENSLWQKAEYGRLAQLVRARH